MSALQNAPRIPIKANGSSSRPFTRKNLQHMAEYATKEHNVLVTVVPEGCGIKVVCRGVFIAGLWFVEDADGSLRPDCALVFGSEEKFNRWRTSEHRVFGVLTERATAAANYFWLVEGNSTSALNSFIVRMNFPLTKQKRSYLTHSFAIMSNFQQPFSTTSKTPNTLFHRNGSRSTGQYFPMCAQKMVED